MAIPKLNWAGPLISLLLTKIEQASVYHKFVQHINYISFHLSNGVRVYDVFSIHRLVLHA